LNVFVIAPTNQNFSGCREIANSIINSPYVKNGLRKPTIMPILSRLDRTDKISGEWFGKFRETFKDLLFPFSGYSDELINSENIKDEIEDFVNSYIENTLLEYKTEISYGERILFHDDLRKIEYTTLEKQILEIAKYIELLNPKIQHKIITDIKTLIADNKLEQAIDLFANQIKHSAYENDIILLKSRFNSVKKQELTGILPFNKFNEIQIEYNTISNSLLRLLNNYLNEKPTNTDNNQISLQIDLARKLSIQKRIHVMDKLLSEYENQAILSSDPKQKIRAEIEINRLKELIKISYDELNDIENG